MSKELTEQWWNGTLPKGLYYTKENEDIRISPCSKHYLLGVLKDCEVLAPVPTYDEYNELEKENRHLKNLLRKTKSSIRDTISVFKGKCIVLDGKYHEKYVKKYQDLLKKITEATKKKGILKNME